MRAGTYLQDHTIYPAKTQISLLIRAVWSDYSQDTLWIAKDLKRPQADS